MLIAVVLIWSYVARTHSVHVTDVTVDRNDETFSLQFCVINPYARRVSVTLEPGVFTRGGGSRLLASISMVVELEPKENRRMTVSLKRPVLTLPSLSDVTNFQPQVLVLSVEQLQ